MNNLFDKDNKINPEFLAVSYPEARLRLLLRISSLFDKSIIEKDPDGNGLIYQILNKDKYSFRWLYDFFDDSDILVYPIYSVSGYWDFRIHRLEKDKLISTDFIYEKKTRIEAELDGLAEAFKILEAQIKSHKEPKSEDKK